MLMISSNAVDGPVYLITQPPFWQGPYRTFYPQIARMFTRLLFTLLSLLRQPVGEARDGPADLILRYCEAQTQELAVIDRIMVDARSCRHAGFEQQFAAEGQAAGADIADVHKNIKGPQRPITV